MIRTRNPAPARRPSCLAGALACLAVVAGCDGAGGPTAPEPLVPLAVQASVGGGDMVAVIAVEVTGAGIPVPIVANLTVVDGSASGTIAVPAGGARGFTGRAFDAESNLTHEGMTTHDVRPGGPPVRIPMFPRGVGVPIEVTVGAYAVAVDPATAELAAGSTLQLAALVTDAGGAPVPDPALTWGSSNPAFAVVDGTGLVTAVHPGELRVAASFHGVAGQALITIVAAGEDPEDPEDPEPALLALAFLDPGASTFTCGLDLDGRAHCWGLNEAGQLGTGDTEGRHLPTPVAGGHTFADLATGNAHACALDPDGAAYCWGQNGDGRLGDGTNTSRLEPTPVTGGHAFTRVYAGYSHSCGITTGGESYCWGWSGWGEIGAGFDSEQTAFPEPTRVLGGHTFQQLALGHEFTCGITTAGTAYCWGLGSDGRRGDNDGYCCRTQPVAVATDSSFVRITAGRAHSCALTGAGNALCWGLNTSGQVGIGSTASPQWVPAPVDTDLAFTAIDAGGAHTCARTATGTAYCWGSNNQGRLGDGTQTNRLSPAAVAGGHAFLDPRAGGVHSCAIASSGLAYCWGGNARGQLGDGTTTMRTQPTLVAGQEVP
jgi:alpha-tubulin suppressor-like RCC1 family protein